MKVGGMGPMNIYRGQFRATQCYKSDDNQPTRYRRSVLFVVYGLPLFVGVLDAILLIAFKVSLSESFKNSMLSALGIIAGALIAAFSQVATWRDKLSAVQEKKENAERPDRWLVDCSAAHLIAGACSALMACVLIILSLLVAPISLMSDWIKGALDVGICVVLMHVVVSLYVALPGFYAAYIQVNRRRR